MFGSGVAVVVLKPWQAAVDDGDRIHAVIRGSAIGNDGSTKMTYAAPNAVGQAEVIAEAQAVADIDASTVSYVETHGTGTPLGDPIEIEGLRQAFERLGCAQAWPMLRRFGQVQHRSPGDSGRYGRADQGDSLPQAPGNTSNAALHQPQPRIAHRPEVLSSCAASTARGNGTAFGGRGSARSVWAAPTRMSFSKRRPQFPGPTSSLGPQVLLLSARTAEALEESRCALAAELSGPDELNLSDVAFTLAGRRKDNIRTVAVVNDRQHAADVLRTSEHDNVFIGDSVTDDTSSERVAFLFPGQGAQHIGMARGLYESEPVFAQHFDRCAAAFDEELGIDLCADIFEGAARNLERTDRAQPALFAVEYALTKLIESYGVRPAALAGHSIGEYVAATVAGIFDLPTAVKAVSMRARLMHAAPRGVMVAVALSPDAIAKYLSPEVDLAAVNEPGGCVIAGSEENIRTFTTRLAEQKIVARRVRTSHAFHSRLMDSVIPEFKAFLSRLTLREPQIPLLSNFTGTWMSASEATNPATWARQIRATVRFSDELDVLLADPCRALVEVGPGGSLTGSATRHPKWSSGHRAVRLMRHQAQNRSDGDTFLLALGQLWAAGIEVDWTPRSACRHPQLVSLPGYPFVRQRHWVDYKPAAGGAAATAATNEKAPSAGAAAPTPAATNGKSQMEDTLQRIWAQCLGVGSIDRNASFFELGGDSLIAISVAMTAANEGLDLTPQDLYENETVAALAKTLIARYAAGGLARQSANDVRHPPISPNIEHFLEHGLREPGRWRIPLILRLRPDLQVEDIRLVLTAVTNHHDALRLRLVHRAGTWEQHLGESQEFTELGTRSLPDGVLPGSSEEREAVLDILNEQIGAQDLSSPPLTATYIRGVADGPCYLAISVHRIAGDNASRDILLTDIFTAFGQRLAGEEIALQPVTTPWPEWSQRCAELAAHPAVVESRDFWLETVAKATLRLTGQVSQPPAADDLVRMSSTLTASETSEIDELRRRLQVPIDEILLAALGRTIAATVGDGAVAVDLGGPGRSVLKPDVDLRRTVGWFTTVYPVALTCVTSQDASARQLLDGVHQTLKAVPHYGIGYGLLRYMCAPTARLLGATPPADLLFSYQGTVPELPAVLSDDAPIQFDADTAMPVREAIPGLGHAVELRVYRSANVLHLDWWYDTRRLGSPAMESLAGQFPATLMELIREVLTEDEIDSASEELVLVDLSSTDVGIGEANAQH